VFDEKGYPELIDISKITREVSFLVGIRNFGGSSGEYIYDWEAVIGSDDSNES
jgi:hypothetical protein